MKKLIIALLAISLLYFCKKEEEPASEPIVITNVVISLKNNNNEAVSGITVYAYTQDTWQTIGDNPLHAQGEVTSNAEGKAFFSNIEYPNAFHDLNNNQNNFRFSAHYSLGGSNKKKVISITFNKGDSKSGEIVLD